jgi:hypothetical protein
MSIVSEIQTIGDYSKVYLGVISNKATCNAGGVCKANLQLVIKSLTEKYVFCPECQDEPVRLMEANPGILTPALPPTLSADIFLSVPDAIRDWQVRLIHGKTNQLNRIFAVVVIAITQGRLRMSNNLNIQLPLFTGDREEVARDTNSNDWYTPSWLIEAVRRVMGDIDLDPASCARANEIVKAKAFYTKEQDGLSKPWYGRVWLNPPYSMPLIANFSDHLLGNPGIEAVMLTRNATETKWCQRLIKESDGFCLLNKRVSFWCPDKPVGQDKCGHIVFYLGKKAITFKETFSSYGVVLTYSA